MELVKKESGSNRLFIDIDEVGLKWALEFSGNQDETIEKIVKICAEQIKKEIKVQIPLLEQADNKDGDNPSIEEL